ncbi:MAG: YybH family protein [Bryobacteraceae bacterium]
MAKFISILICFAAAAAGAQDARAVLDAQVAAWNRGDLESFVETYENSPAITFLGKELSYGRAEVLARYKRTYNTAEKMGTLRFEVLKLRPLGKDHAMVLGKFFLTRSAAGGGDASGHFTLILHKGPSGWKIIHDHTS